MSKVRYWVNVDTVTKSCTVHTSECSHQPRKSKFKKIRSMGRDGGWMPFYDHASVDKYLLSRFSDFKIHYCEDAQTTREMEIEEKSDKPFIQDRISGYWRRLEKARIIIDGMYYGLRYYLFSLVLLFFVDVGSRFKNFYVQDSVNPDLVFFNYSKLFNFVKSYAIFFARPDINLLPRQFLLICVGFAILFLPNKPEVNFVSDWMDKQIVRRFLKTFELKTRYYYRQIGYKLVYMAFFWLLCIIAFTPEPSGIILVVYIGASGTLVLLPHFITKGELVTIYLDEYLDNRNTSSGNKSLSKGLKTLNKIKSGFIKPEVISKIIIKIYAYDEYELNDHIPSLHKLTESVELLNRQRIMETWLSLARLGNTEDQEIDFVDILAEPKIPRMKKLYQLSPNWMALILPLLSYFMTYIQNIIKNNI